ncbi:50S ribosomal protein L29 [Candidatus Kaiserbacteria bacterium RIFCSPHIGHO2_02_FULL_50_9]|uniref:Large ribosomal subunit protein uL29 n=1 Tax=Candidatus Kaiserbacteria bacterium RIFCSPLOWO2_01_FULL_51_21 TaxID=1798508 RepID=A0A1F6ECI7_9BACT|nr:MAG: 50S ribosomal protein L29 [Candidatus Kaiserbacteria bacterium RIFCSPHIGHO2_01_FULL_51_33]OGG63360.1 MAG: 50S ribosomal protein L29 [Candidatus Kaiserbacteria bacterium RIFCSPHIGHO2_02_FULL_50_9]OGG71389.1 MAG: 50S ribosomal protein L29 [Candidatus Kaiserbacteria bacterium RIFCSPLOWO2_01_FULL_51_21]
MIDLKNKTPMDLKKLLLEKQEALRQFRFGLAGSKARNVKEGKNLHKDIARINTKLKQLSKTA